VGNQNQPERWEAAILAVALAITGTLCLFDKLGAVLWSGLFSWHALLHVSPALLAAVAISLVVADEPVSVAPRGAKGRQREGQL